MEKKKDMCVCVYKRNITIGRTVDPEWEGMRERERQRDLPTGSLSSQIAAAPAKAGTQPRSSMWITRTQ